MSGRTRSRGNEEAQHARREAGCRLLLSKRYKQAEIAKILGVSHGTVRGWSSQLKSGKDLQVKRDRGCSKGTGKLLTNQDERKIIKIIRDKNPQQMKLEFYLWSIGAVMTLIEQKCGVVLSESCVRKYLKRWGFTVQRPSTRYSRRDDIVVQNWLKTEYPKIAVLAKKEGAEIHWLDETGVNNQAIYQRGFSPKGKTPVTQKPAKRERISLISTVTNQGTMRFRLFEGGLKKALFIEFLEQLVRDAGRKIFVIMDNLPVHKGKEVMAWSDLNSDKITIFYLPPYAPDLNPDEYLNNDLKQNVHTRSGLPKDKNTLKANVLGYMRHIQKSPEKVKGYFQANETRYAA